LWRRTPCLGCGASEVGPCPSPVRTARLGQEVPVQESNDLPPQRLLPEGRPTVTPMLSLPKLDGGFAQFLWICSCCSPGQARAAVVQWSTAAPSQQTSLPLNCFALRRAPTLVLLPYAGDISRSTHSYSIRRRTSTLIGNDPPSAKKSDPPPVA
jgi:hypothetical protein